MWKLLIIVSAINGFGGNADGGVAVHEFSAPFSSHQACEEIKIQLEKIQRPNRIMAICLPLNK